MTLADLIGRGVNVEWHEAVAIVRDAIERSDIARSACVPEFDQVGLLPFGEVEVHGGTKVEDPAQGLVANPGRADQSQQLPAPFVDLVAEGDGSVEALADALAYFERPDRVGILRAVSIAAPAEARHCRTRTNSSPHCGHRYRLRLKPVSRRNGPRSITTRCFMPSAPWC